MKKSAPAKEANAAITVVRWPVFMIRCSKADRLRRFLLPVIVVLLGLFQGGLAYSQGLSPVPTVVPTSKPKPKAKPRPKLILVSTFTPQQETTYKPVVTPLPELASSPTLIPLQALTANP